MRSEKFLKLMNPGVKSRDNAMRVGAHQFKVLLAVIVLLAIYVVNVLPCFERPTKFAGHDDAMLHHVAPAARTHDAPQGIVSGDPQRNVTFLCLSPTTLPGPMAIGTERFLCGAGLTHSADSSASAVPITNALPLDPPFLSASLTYHLDRVPEVHGIRMHSVPVDKTVRPLLDIGFGREHLVKPGLKSDRAARIVASLACALVETRAKGSLDTGWPFPSRLATRFADNLHKEGVRPAMATHLKAVPVNRSALKFLDRRVRLKNTLPKFCHLRFHRSVSWSCG